MSNISLYVTDRDQTTDKIESELTESSVMQVLLDANVDIEAVCGGCCSCGTCHVYVDPQWYQKFDVPEEAEVTLLQYSEHYDAQRSRLSCQLVLSPEIDGLQVILAPED